MNLDTLLVFTGLFLFTPSYDLSQQEFLNQRDTYFQTIDIDDAVVFPVNFSFVVYQDIIGVARLKLKETANKIDEEEKTVFKELPDT